MFSKKYFPGNNTPSGFYSLFDEILNNYETKFIIKGGPGTGKSTFMKKIASELQPFYKLEGFYCASDTNSLDAVGFLEPKAVIIDGTNPHTLDPSTPGAGEYLIDLGRFLNHRKLKPQREKILEIQTLVKTCYQISYSYLKQAKQALLRELQLYPLLDCHHKLKELKNTLIEFLFPAPFNYKPAVKKSFFTRAYSPEGTISLLDSLINESTKLISLEGNLSTSDRLLKLINNYSLSHGLTTEIYPHPLEPGLIESLRIPDLNTIYYYKDNYPELKNSGAKHLTEIKIPGKNENSRLNQYKIKELKEACRQQKELINKAIYHLSHMKKIRGELEEIYSSSQDFNMVESIRLEITKKIIDSTN